MINFGVREVANSKATTAPGWAYVPDLAPNSAVTALQPRKRARNASSGASLHETTARQDAKILRELAALDRENHRDVNIPVPIKGRDGAGRISHGKVTPSVKKILQSQKTFINHLSDFEAHLAIAGSTATPLPPAPATPIPRPTPGATPTNLMIAGKRSHKKKDQISVPAPTPIRKATSASQLAATPALANTKSEPQDKDTPMLDAPPSHIVLAPGNCKIPEPHPGDTDPLLISRIPGMPSQAEIEELLAQPPLTYAEARGPWVDEDSRKPVRIFCEVCGYWGRVRCTRCGGRVCALECLGVHQEECFTRYGA